MTLEEAKLKHEQLVRLIERYSKEYYVSSYNVYGKGTVLKSMNRNSDGNTLVTTRNYDGTYTTKSIK